MMIKTINKRVVYIWSDKRALIESTGDYIGFRRATMPVDELNKDDGLLEAWVKFDEPIPVIVDDSWEEEYKLIDNSKAFLEWHPQQKLLRLMWDQQLESYQEGKVKSVVLELLRSLQLELPPLVKAENL